MDDLVDVLSHAGAEHRVRDDFEGQLPHFSRDVDWRSFLGCPPGHLLFSHLGHPIDHGRDASAVENRLDDTTMPLPHVARRGDQPIAQDQRQAGRSFRIVHFRKSVGVFDEHVFGEIGMAEQIARCQAQPKAQCIAVLAPPGRELFERTCLVRMEVTQERRRPRNIDQREGRRRIRHEEPYHTLAGAEN